MFENPYKILNINDDSTIDEVKKAYRKIALKSHPDKLNNIKDIEEKNKKIKEFTEATNAYNQILNNEDFNININYNNWEETFDLIINSQLFKDFLNVMTKNNNIITHSFNLDITYSDYYSKNKKKIRIFLKDFDEPIFIDLDCKQYPQIIITHYDENDIEHEIIFNLSIVNNNKNYYHIKNNDESIDIIHDMLITTVEYITGNIREHVFLNKEILLIKIEPFAKNYIINDLGINKGKFICNFIYIPIPKKDWNKLNDNDKNSIIRIFNLIK
jgi:curved DNA-binding protein CbpA